jgi:CBS domain-containing protein
VKVNHRNCYSISAETSSLFIVDLSIFSSFSYVSVGKTFMRLAPYLKVMPTVKDLMTKNVVTIDADKTVIEAATLMSLNDIGDLIIMDNDVPVGIVTERDLVRRVLAEAKPRETKVSEVMTTPLKVIDPEAPIKEAARRMVNRRIRRLPVIKNNKLVGIITAADFAKHLSKKTLSDDILEAMGRSHYPVPDAFEK